MNKLQAMRQAVFHVDRILAEELPRWFYIGVTEQQIFDQLSEAISAKGKYGLSFAPIVAFGANGADPHHEPTATELSTGDTILIDCGAMFDGQCSDCTRMFSFGEATGKFSQKFTKLLSVQRKAINRFVAGAGCSELDARARVDLGKDAPFFIHTLGHGVGAEVHIPPRIGADSTEILKAGDIVTCEPGIYIPGQFGIRIEDQLIIQKKGLPEILTLCPQELGVMDAWGGITYRG